MNLLKIWLLLVLWCAPSVLCAIEIFADDPYSDELSSPDFVPPEEPYTNLTMDQLISQAYGGSDAYMSDYFMDPASGNYLAEMDMRLEPDQFAALYGEAAGGTRRKKRKAVRQLRYRWTDNTVPYEFAPGHFNSREVYTVKESLKEWSDATCIKFRPATYNDRNKVRFQNGAGCNSALGMVGGTQAINLQSPSCRYKGLYLHEMGHALGLVHEHQLPDRDTYIYILYNNVSPALRIWFNKYSTSEVNQYGVPYEYSSVMHYGVTAFSVDGRSKTIKTKDPSKEHLIGRVYLKGLSFSDIKVVNLMYQCNKHCKADPTCKDPGYLDKNCKCVCPKGVDCSSGTGTGGGGGGTTSAPVTKPPVITCTNTWPGSQCNAWAQRGECDANPDWMLVNCQKSCNSCPTGPTTTATSTTTTPATTTTPTAPTTTTTHAPSTTTYMPSPPTSATTTTTTTGTPTTTVPQPCVNSWPGSMCDSWATGGQCDENPMFMNVLCQRSCDLCPTTAPTTPGTTVSGGTTVTGPPVTTASDGTTTAAPSSTTTTPSGPTTTYMPSTPPPTTTASTSTTSTTTTTTTTTATTARPCVNQWGNYDCNNWSRTGECTRNPVWMRQHCARACNACSGGGGGGGGGRNCQNRHTNCNYWARTGYCRRSSYMTTNCRRACNLCNR